MIVRNHHSDNKFIYLFIGCVAVLVFLAFIS